MSRNINSSNQFNPVEFINISSINNNQNEERIRGLNIGPEAHLERADLQDANLRGRDLRKAHLEEADLRRAHLEGAILEGAYLEGAHLERAHLEGSHLEGAHLEGAHLERTDLEEAHLEEAHLEGAHLEGAHLERAHLQRAHLQRAHLERADLEEAHLEEAHLEGAHLEGAHLQRAHLEGARLEEAHLKKTNLKRTHLERAHLEAAVLIEAHLVGAHLEGAHLEEADLRVANLEGAHLEGAHLERADLRRAHLKRANLSVAHLEGADLKSADLDGVDLRGAHLEGAHLEEADLRGAHLEGAHLEGAHLEGANLRGAHLEGAHLEGANFEGVDLSQVLMTVREREIIELSTRRRLSQRFFTSANFSASARPSDLDFPKQSNLTFSTNQYGRVIHIPRKYLEFKNNSANKSCPSFKPLYDQIMLIDLDGRFRFEFQGQTGRDLTGLTRIVFDKLLPIYTNLFFEKERGSDFILLKEIIDMDLLFQHTMQIIKLAKAAHSQIQLRINPQLLEFLSLRNPPESIATRQNFNKLYANFKALINISGNNVSNFLMNNTLKPQIKAVQGNLGAVNRALKAEILFRKTVNDFGFTSWKQYHNMALFIKAFWNTSNENKITKNKVKLDLFVTELKFDFESFIKRIKIIREHTGEILDISRIPVALFGIYPALQSLLHYISYPNDENRKTFVKYVTGTEYSPAEILIKLTNNTMDPGLHNGLPFYGHSCSNTIDLYRAPPNFEGEITQNIINTQLKATTSNKSDLRVAE